MAAQIFNGVNLTQLPGTTSKEYGISLARSLWTVQELRDGIIDPKTSLKQQRAMSPNRSFIFKGMIFVLQAFALANINMFI